MRKISSWGRLEAPLHSVVALEDRARARDQVVASLVGDKKGLAYGMGRSYGDVCLNAQGVLWDMRGLDKYIAFDDQTGILACEAGVLLRDIQRLVIPRGWILPVTPGTQLITVGGAIANDVHGKNHHVLGSFGDHVQQIRLLRSDGSEIICGPDSNQPWFAATVGGLGLTGVMLDVVLRLRRVEGPWMDTETLPYENLDEFFYLSDASEEAWEHTVSWVDCISGGGGRGIFMRGNPVKSDKPWPRQGLKLMVPFVPPLSAVNQLSLRAFNSFYYGFKKNLGGRALVAYEPFFYPLDNILEWNRIYGPKGFFQYQSVVPREGGKEAVQEMLRAIARSGDGSFLAVLKTFSKRKAVGMMSFPQDGVTLALDFPNKGARTHKLFERLDAIVREAKGRLYLAKDARMSAAMFEAGYPELSAFLRYRDEGISSSLSRRLMGV